MTSGIMLPLYSRILCIIIFLYDICNFFSTLQNLRSLATPRGRKIFWGLPPKNPKFVKNRLFLTWLTRNNALNLINNFIFQHWSLPEFCMSPIFFLIRKNILCIHNFKRGNCASLISSNFFIWYSCSFYLPMYHSRQN